MDDDRLRRGVRALVLAMAVLTSGSLVLVLGQRVAAALTGAEMAPWLLARASGFTSYVLVLLLVLAGMLLSHPTARRLRGPSPVFRLRLHIALAVFTLAFTALHVVVLATDPWAQVGWGGALLPMASTYRPVPVTLGVLAVWSGLVTGVTASLAGRVASRIWWPVHKVAALVFLLVWAHSVLAGTDTAALLWFYLSSGGLVLALGISRYAATSPADRVRDLTRSVGVRADQGAHR